MVLQKEQTYINFMRSSGKKQGGISMKLQRCPLLFCARDTKILDFAGKMNFLAY